MTQLEKAQKVKLKSLFWKVQTTPKTARQYPKKTGYEDLGQGVLTLQIAQHAAEETLE